MSGILPKMKNILLGNDRTRPVSPKKAKMALKKSFLFELQASLSRALGKPSNASFSCEAGAALTFFDFFFVSKQKRNWSLGQSPIA